VCALYERKQKSDQSNKTTKTAKTDDNINKFTYLALNELRKCIIISSHDKIAHENYQPNEKCCERKKKEKEEQKK
jgi:hypothetical protein